MKKILNRTIASAKIAASVVLMIPLVVAYFVTFPLLLLVYTILSTIEKSNNA